MRPLQGTTSLAHLAVVLSYGVFQLPDMKTQAMEEMVTNSGDGAPEEEPTVPEVGDNKNDGGKTNKDVVETDTDDGAVPKVEDNNDDGAETKA